MLQLTNGEAPGQLAPKCKEYTGAILLRTRPRTYRKVVELLAQPNWSVLRISEACRVSRNTVDAIAIRESATVEQRKNELVTMFSDVAHIATGRVADTVGKACARDAIVAAGVSVDKMLALLGQNPQVAIQVNLPSDAERASTRELHAKLDALTKRLSE